jgi:hypothetical protein
MNPDLDLAAALWLMIIGQALAARFRVVTGMTLDEWDELNYQRIMSSDDRPA